MTDMGLNRERDLIKEILSPADPLTEIELLHFVRYLERYCARIYRNRHEIDNAIGLLNDMEPFYMVAVWMMGNRRIERMGGDNGDSG